MQMMIVHHQVAVGMANQTMGHATHPQLRTLAGDIAAEQSAQITQVPRTVKRNDSPAVSRHPARSSGETMFRNIWNEYVVPRCTDMLLRGKQVTELRRRALSPAHGRVLEIGYGSGLNVPLYPSTVTVVLAVEPSSVARSRAAGRESASMLPVRHIGLDGQAIRAHDASADTVVCTFTLCTIPDPTVALREIRRVLRPEGRFLFLEHGLAQDAPTQRWQHRLTPIQRRLFGGCHLERPIDTLISQADLHLTSLQHERLPLPRPVAPAYLGQARPQTQTR